MNELSKELMCVQIRSGVEIWVEKDRAANLMKLLTTADTKFIEFDGQIFNRADIVGVFTATTMEELTRRKNGQWKCAKGAWHDKRQDCECRRSEGHTELPEIEEITDEQRAKNRAAIAKARKESGF